jgi:hypothetical protein
MEWWSDGVMEWWSDGVVEWWSDGVVEWWSGGVVEWWSGPSRLKSFSQDSSQIGRSSVFCNS